MQNKLHVTLESALMEEKVSVNLYGCNECGFVFNADFIDKKTEYSSIYDNTQDDSIYFQSYLIKLAERLDKKYQLFDKKVVEVGCGKGHFIKIIYDLGVKNIRGYDPSYIDYNKNIDRLVIKKFFDDKNVDEKVDFIICRHVLEHIKNPDLFVFSIEKCLNVGGSMYFEFPSLEWIVKNEVFFDFFYEHCNYFSKRSLSFLFNKIGLGNIVFNYGLDGQYFQLDISRGKCSDLKLLDLINFDDISNFLSNKINEYKKMVEEMGTFIVWGAGAKGVTFLNRLNISVEKCQYVIDINLNKQNKFIPITGQEIVSPKILKKIDVNTIIVMNPVYEEEIKKMASSFGYNGKFILLH
ncbi:MAG: class I SAM-dependent methyltransferase [Candidatus Magasanikbacteria bacterium]